MRTASSEELHRRVSKLPAGQRDSVMGEFEAMRLSWCEEAMAKWKYWGRLPHIMLGMWPADEHSQGMAILVHELRVHV